MPNGKIEETKALEEAMAPPESGRLWSMIQEKELKGEEEKALEEGLEEERFAMPRGAMATEELQDEIARFEEEYYNRLVSREPNVPEGTHRIEAAEEAGKMYQHPLERSKRQPSFPEEREGIPGSLSIALETRRDVVEEERPGQLGEIEKQKAVTKKHKEILDKSATLDLAGALWESVKSALDKEPSEVSEEIANENRWARDFVQSVKLFSKAAVPVNPSLVMDAASAIFGSDKFTGWMPQDIVKAPIEMYSALEEGGADIAKMKGLEKKALEAYRSTAEAVAEEVPTPLKVAIGPTAWLAEGIRAAGVLEPKLEGEVIERAIVRPSQAFSLVASELSAPAEELPRDEMEAYRNSLFLGLAPQDIPKVEGVRAPTFADLQAAWEEDPSLVGNPDYDWLNSYLSKGDAEGAESFMKRLPYGQMPEALRERVMPDDKVLSKAAEDVAKYYEATGGKAIDAVMAAAGAALTREEIGPEGKIRLVETPTMKALRVLSITPDIAMEIDISPFWGAANTIRALTPEAVEEVIEPALGTLEAVKIPTLAGIDSMLASDELRPYLNPVAGWFGLNLDYYQRVREPDVGYLPRLMAGLETGHAGMALGMTDIAMGLGVEEDANAYLITGGIGVALDWLVNWETGRLMPHMLISRGLKAPVTLVRGYRAAGKLLPKGASMLAEMSPEYAAARLERRAAAPGGERLREFIMETGRLAPGEEAASEALQESLEELSPGISQAARGIEGGDLAETFGYLAYATMDSNYAKGVDSLKLLDRADAAWLRDAAELLGRDANEVIEKYAKSTVENGDEFKAMLADFLENGGTPEMRALRRTPEYMLYNEAAEGAVDVGVMPAENKPFFMMMREMEAWRTAQNPDIPDIKSPIDYFRRLSEKEVLKQPGIGVQRYTPGELVSLIERPLSDLEGIPIFGMDGIPRTLLPEPEMMRASFLGDFKRALVDQMSARSRLGLPNNKLDQAMKDVSISGYEVPEPLTRVLNRHFATAETPDLAQKMIDSGWSSANMAAFVYARGLGDEYQWMKKVVDFEARGEMRFVQATELAFGDARKFPKGQSVIAEFPPGKFEVDQNLADKLVYQNPDGSFSAPIMHVEMPLRGLTQGQVSTLQAVARKSKLDLEIHPDGYLVFHPGENIDQSLRLMKRAADEIADALNEMPLPTEALEYAERMGISPERRARGIAVRWIREDADRATPRRSYGRGISVQRTNPRRAEGNRRIWDRVRRSIQKSAERERPGHGPREREFRDIPLEEALRRGEEYRRAKAGEPEPAIKPERAAEGLLEEAVVADVAASRTATTPGEMAPEAKPIRRTEGIEDAEDAARLHEVYRTGRLEELFKNNGRLFRRIVGEEEAESLIGSFDHMLDLNKRKVLTPEGEKEASEALMNFIRTNKASTSKRLIYREAADVLRDGWLSIRGQHPLPLAREYFWDKLLRPDDPVRAYSIGTISKAGKEVPWMKVGRTPAERLEAGKVMRAGKAMEARRTAMQTEELMRVVGMKSLDEEVSAPELVHRLMAYRAAEKARLRYRGELVKLTDRTVVPVKRVKGITERVERRIGTYMGIDDSSDWRQIADAIEVDKDTGLEQLRLNHTRAVGLKCLVKRLAADPLGEAGIPERLKRLLLKDDVTPWMNSVTPQEYDKIRKVVTDYEAGLGVRRWREAEAVPPSFAYGVLRGLSKAIDRVGTQSESLGRLQGYYNRVFGQEVMGKGERYTGAVGEIFERHARRVRNAHNRMNEFALNKWRKNSALGMKQVLEDMSTGSDGILQDPIPADMRLGVMKGKEASGKPEVSLYYIYKQFRDKRYVDNVDGWTQDKTDIVRGFFDHKGAMTANEEASLVQIDRVVSKKSMGMKLEDADIEILREGLKWVEIGMNRRMHAVRERGIDIALAISGSRDWSILHGAMREKLPPHEVDNMLFEFVDRFYKPERGVDWEEGLFDISSTLGRATGFEEIRTAFQRDRALVEAVYRLMVRDSFNGLAKDLAEYGLMVNPADQLEKLSIRAADPDKFIDRVQWYINKELSWVLRGQTKEAQAVDLMETPQARKTEVHWAPPSAKEPSLWGPEETPSMHDREAYLTAHRLLHQWGYKFGKGTWERTVLPDGSEVLLPGEVREYLTEAINRIAPAGTAYGRMPMGTGVADAFTASMDWMLRYSPLTFSRVKMGCTTGIALPNPAYYVVNAVSGPFLMYQGLGAGGTARALSGVSGRELLGLMRGPDKLKRLKAIAGGAWQNADMTRAVVTRMWKHGQHKAEARPIITKGGGIYTADMIAEAAIDEGLKSGFIEAEVVKDIFRDLKNHEPTWWDKMMKDSSFEQAAQRAMEGTWVGKKLGGKLAERRGLVRSLRWHQDNLLELATASDNVFRVSTFIDAIKRGISPSQAAEEARRIMFDYSDMSDVERKFFRNAIMFYSFMKKNLDLTWHTMLTNPHRILGQLRAMKGLNEIYLQEDAELIQDEWQQQRAGVYFRTLGAKSHIDTEQADPNSHVYSQAVWLGPLLPVNDAVSVTMDFIELLSAPFRGDVEGSGGFASRLAPWVQFPFVDATGVDIWSGRELGTYDRVPGWLVEWDRGFTGGVLVDDILAVEPVDHWDFAKQDAPGMPWYRVREDRARAWWIFKNLIQLPPTGRATDTITWMDRASIPPMEIITETARQRSLKREGEPRERFFGLGEPAIRKQAVGRYPGEDIVQPPPGLSALDAFWGLLGFKPYLFLTREARTADLERWQKQDVEEARKQERRGIHELYPERRP